MGENRKVCFARGLRDGLPIGLGYLAVGFTLGIAARRAGLTAFQAGLTCFLTNASAGGYAGITVIAENGTYLTMAVMILVANARYLLMSAALSQRISPETGLIHRFLIAFEITDEVFGVEIASPGFLRPAYAYGVFVLPLIGWGSGAYLGVVMGNLLPASLVSALSVGLYGMFLAIIVPPARKDRVVGVLVVLSMALSWLFGVLPPVSRLSAGTRVILLTVVIAGAAAALFPRRETGPEAGQEEKAS